MLWHAIQGAGGLGSPYGFTYHNFSTGTEAQTTSVSFPSGTSTGDFYILIVRGGGVRQEGSGSVILQVTTNNSISNLAIIGQTGDYPEALGIWYGFSSGNSFSLACNAPFGSSINSRYCSGTVYVYKPIDGYSPVIGDASTANVGTDNTDTTQSLGAYGSACFNVIGMQNATSASGTYDEFRTNYGAVSWDDDGTESLTVNASGGPRVSGRIIFA
jgi:hypothetical protein